MPEASGDRHRLAQEASVDRSCGHEASNTACYDHHSEHSFPLCRAMPLTLEADRQGHIAPAVAGKERPCPGIPRPLTPSAPIGRPPRARSGMLLKALTEPCSQRLRIRQDLRDLLSLDDAALHDIGLSRGGIEHAGRLGVARPRPARPSLPHPAWPSDVCFRSSSWTEWR